VADRMKSVAASLLVLLLTACGPAGDAGGEQTSRTGPLPGVHQRVDGIDIWMDTIPDRDFELVRQGVDLGLPQTPEAPVFPADRMQAAAAVARELGGNAAVIRTIADTTDADPPRIYIYETDVIRYRTEIPAAP
jgi:hypothetical protein